MPATALANPAPPADETRRIPGNKGIWVGITCEFVEFIVLFAALFLPLIYFVVTVSTLHAANVAAAHAAIRAKIPFLDRDRALDGEVATAVRLVESGEILSAVRNR